MKTLQYLRTIISLFYSCINKQPKTIKPAEFENDIYFYLGKTLSIKELEQLNKRYDMKIRFEVFGGRRYSNGFFEYQIELDKEPHFEFIVVKNNKFLLPFNLNANDNLKSIKQKLGEPTIIDYKDNSIYYFDKYLLIKFKNIEDSLSVFEEIGFLANLKTGEVANERKAFIEYSNKIYFEKKSLDPTKPDFPIGFGYKWYWYAARSNDLPKIANILELKDISNCNWESGIDQAYGNGDIFLTPSVDGWTLIVGALPNHEQEFGKIKELLNKLSKVFGESQFFCTHRVAEYHCWIRSINGVVTRAYAYAGESMINYIVEGEPTSFEKNFNLVNTFSDESKNNGYFERNDLVIPDEQFLMDLANAWSVNPSKLDERKELGKGIGMIGKQK